VRDHVLLLTAARRRHQRREVERIAGALALHPGVEIGAPLRRRERRARRLDGEPRRERLGGVAQPRVARAAPGGDQIAEHYRVHVQLDVSVSPMLPLIGPLPWSSIVTAPLPSIDDDSVAGMAPVSLKL